jgi:hypothetical protein
MKKNSFDTMARSLVMERKNCHKKTPFPGQGPIQPSTST